MERVWCRRRSARAPARRPKRDAAAGRWVSVLGAAAGRLPGGRAGADGTYEVYSNSNGSGLGRAECDDAPDRIVRRNADRHAIARYYLDTEAAHSAAQLGQHLVTGVALHAV